MSTPTYDVKEVAFTAFTDQKPGTSGLRKPTKTFQQPHYTESFVQAILTAAESPKRLFVGGDGRYFVKEALLQSIIPICAANGVAELLVGHDGIMSTPAASHIIRKYHLNGGILLTASHNPGGPDADFGIKYNCSNGGPAPEKVTDAIYAETVNQTAYHTLGSAVTVDLSRLGKTILHLSNGHAMEVNVISSVSDYVEYMKELFDFEAIKQFLKGSEDVKPFKILVSGLHGVMGPYIEQTLYTELDLPSCSAIKSKPLPDFGGGHPDPNLTYAADLVDAVKEDQSIGLAAAFDGDGDRNMVIGRNGFFVSPCDWLAVIAENSASIKQFQNKPITGFARSMPTSRALDVVCAARKMKCFEVPTGWKFFGNLMDAKLCSVCGEESFGTGSNHIREKDGMWALLAWLSILASRQAANKPFEVEDVLKDVWKEHGRYFFTRYDFENIETDKGAAIMDSLYALIKKGIKGEECRTSCGKMFTGGLADDYTYVDPVDNSTSSKQGIRLFFEDGTRFVFRLSGTGSSGATLRVYIDTFEEDRSKHSMASEAYLKPYIELALKLCRVTELTGRTEPTVIT